MKKTIFNPKTTELKLNENEIHIWNINLDQAGNSASSLIKILSEEEIIRANKFYFEADKERYIHSRVILRLLLNTYTKIPVKDISFIQNEFGKPGLQTSLNGNQLNFNISHSKNVFCLAFCRNESIGIDVEIIKPVSDYIQIAKRYFSDFETEQLKMLPVKDRPEGFYSCWTSKEAVIKLIGKGLSVPLKDFDTKIKIIEKGKSYRYKVKIKNEEDTISVESFRPEENIFGACAVKSETFNTIYFELDEQVYSLKNFLDDNLKPDST